MRVSNKLAHIHLRDAGFTATASAQRDLRSYEDVITITDIADQVSTYLLRCSIGGRRIDHTAAHIREGTQYSAQRSALACRLPDGVAPSSADPDD